MKTPSRNWRITLWFLTVILALPLFSAGLPKLLGLGGWVALFAHFGYPAWLVPLVGIVEVSGVVLLFMPRFASIGATMIAVVMVGALTSHSTHQEWSRVVMTGINWVVALVIAWARWPQLRLPGTTSVLRPVRS